MVITTTKGQPDETVFYGDELPQVWRDQELIQRYRNALVDYWLIEEEKKVIVWKTRGGWKRS
jgi:hypothetical protein